MAPPRLRAAVWSRGPVAPAFLTRLRGQTVELPVDLVEASADDLPDQPLEAQVRTADRLARVIDARIVVWWSGGNVVMFLASPAPSRLLVRAVATDAPAVASARADPSAGLESAALIVRSALVAVLHGGTFGEPHVSAVAAAPVAPPRPTFSVFVLGHGLLAWDGANDTVLRGLGLHLGVGWRRLSVGATGMIAVDRDVGAFHPQPFGRRNLAAFVGWRVIDGERYHLTAEVAGGASRWSLFRLLGSVAETHLLFSLELRGGVDVVSVGRLRIPLWCGVGLDYIPKESSFVVGSSDDVVWHTKKIEPRLMVGTGATF